jgi:hypothetical protein
MVELKMAELRMAEWFSDSAHRPRGSPILHALHPVHFHPFQFLHSQFFHTKWLSHDSIATTFLLIALSSREKTP